MHIQWNFDVTNFKGIWKFYVTNSYCLASSKHSYGIVCTLILTFIEINSRFCLYSSLRLITSLARGLTKMFVNTFAVFTMKLWFRIFRDNNLFVIIMVYFCMKNCKKEDFSGNSAKSSSLYYDWFEWHWGRSNSNTFSASICRKILQKELGSKALKGQRTQQLKPQLNLVIGNSANCYSRLTD